MIRNQFPHDQDNRIQKLYYDVNIHTISNRTKLQNVKNKFWKYLKYLQKKYNMSKKFDLHRYLEVSSQRGINNDAIYIGIFLHFEGSQPQK